MGFKDLMEVLNEKLIDEKDKIIYYFESGENSGEYSSELFHLKKFNLGKKDNYYFCNPELDVKEGVYIFYAKEDTFQIPNTFDDVKYGAKLREGSCTEAKRCLYLGKSYDVKKRIKEHLSNEGEKSPYSLKCSHCNREALFDGAQIYVFALKTEYKDYKAIILSTIESMLHEEFEPMIGTKRV